MLTRCVAALLFAPLLTACVTSSGFSSQYRADSEAQDRDRRSKNLANDLDALEQRFRAEGLRSPEVFHTGGLWWAIHHPEQPIDGADALKQRLAAYERNVAAAAGATAVYGDGARSMEPLQPAVREILTKALQECNQASLQQLARVDAAALAHIERSADVRRYVIDMKMAAVECVAKAKAGQVAADEARLDREDEFPAIKLAPVHRTKGCGVHTTAFAGEHLGRGAYGTYSWLTAINAVEGPTSNAPYFGTPSEVEPLACGKFPRQKPVPSELRDAVGEYMQYHRLRNATFVFSNKRENRRYRWVTASVYSNEFNVPDDVNPCGAPDLVCSFAGSPAMTDFEKVAYFLQRAATNRDAGRVERCNKNLVNAQNAYQHYVAYRADLEKKHEWVPSLRYKTSLAPKPMSDAELEASFAQKARAIEDALRTDDCAKPRSSRR